MWEQPRFTLLLIFDIMQQQVADPMMLLLVQIIAGVIIVGIVVDQLRRWLLRYKPQTRRVRRQTRRPLQSSAAQRIKPRVRVAMAQTIRPATPARLQRVPASSAQTPHPVIQRLRQIGVEQEQELWEAQDQLAETRSELAGALAQIAELERKVVQASAKRLPTISLNAVATASTVLIVGSRGSGKTTLLQAMLQRRADMLYIFDPHAAAQKWPAKAIITGGGRNFAAIYKKLLWAYDTMDARSKQQAGQPEGSIAFPAFSLASDEWGSVIANLAKEERKPGSLTLDLLKEGRKFKIGFIASAHGDSVKSVLGVDGDYAAFINSFDWIIYTGAFVTEKLKLHPEIVHELPWGVNEENIRFPLVVAAYQPTTRSYALLDLRGIAVHKPVRSEHRHEQPTNGERLLKRVLASFEQQPVQKESLAPSGSEPLLAPSEQPRAKIKRRVEIRDAALSELTLAQQEQRAPSKNQVARTVFGRSDGPYRQQVKQVIEEEQLWPSSEND